MIATRLANCNVVKALSMPYQVQHLGIPERRKAKTTDR